MPSSRRPYPPEFREEAVRLVREHGKPMAAVARDLGVSVESLRQWIQRAEVEEGKREGLTEAERDELRRLWRENRVLREEREIQKKPQPSSPRSRAGTRSGVPLR